MRNVRILRTTPAKPIDQEILNKASVRQDASTFGTKYLPPTWGKVIKISGPCHVDVELVNGIVLRYVPIASSRWVKKISSSKSTGRKDIPPVDAKVLVLFVDGIVENPLIIASGFDPLVPAQTSKLLADGTETESIEVDEAEWSYVEDKETGDISIESPGTGTTLKLDIDMQAKTIKLQATGFTIEVNGTVAPTGAGPFCGLPNCLFTGAPHVGPKITGT